MDPAFYNTATFVNVYELYPLNDLHWWEGSERAAVMSTYFVFTSLTTVGFGDYYPHSDLERILAVVMFLFAGAIFAKALGEFGDILAEYDELKGEIEYSGDLISFMAMLEHFNNGNEMSREKRREYEDYFTYRWKNDRNAAIDDDDELSILLETPVETQVTLIVRGLHRVFMREFMMYFAL